MTELFISPCFINYTGYTAPKQMGEWLNVVNQKGCERKILDAIYLQGYSNNMQRPQSVSLFLAMDQ
jgi:hypothetical protein